MSEKNIAGEPEDQRIVGEEWKNDLSVEDRDLANEVEQKLEEVKKQMKLIEEHSKKLQNRMTFPFGQGSSPPPKPTLKEHDTENATKN